MSRQHHSSNRGHGSKQLSSSSSASSLSSSGHSSNTYRRQTRSATFKQRTQTLNPVNGYIHHGWCQEIFREEKYRNKAINILQDMGALPEKLSSTDLQELTSDRLCEKLDHRAIQLLPKTTSASSGTTTTTSRIDGSASSGSGSGKSETKKRHGERLSASATEQEMADSCLRVGIPTERHIFITMYDDQTKTKVKTCWDVVQLQDRLIRDDKFAARLSDFQLLQVQKQVNALSSKDLPCYMYSGHEDLCLAQSSGAQKCAFNRRTLIGSLFGAESSKRMDKLCYSSRSAEETHSKCADMKESDLRNTVEGYALEQLAKMDVKPDGLTVFQIFWYRRIREFTARKLHAALKKLSHSQLCKEVSGFLEEKKAYDDKNFFPEELIANFLAKKYLTVELLEDYYKKWCTYTNKNGSEEAKTQCEAFTISKDPDVRRLLKLFVTLINLVLFYIENFSSITFVTWLIVFPAGRKMVKTVLSAPGLVGVFLMVLSLNEVPLAKDLLAELAKVVPASIANQIPEMAVTVGKSLTSLGLQTVISKETARQDAADESKSADSGKGKRSKSSKSSKSKSVAMLAMA